MWDLLDDSLRSAMMESCRPSRATRVISSTARMYLTSGAIGVCSSLSDWPHGEYLFGPTYGPVEVVKNGACQSMTFRSKRDGCVETDPPTVWLAVQMDGEVDVREHPFRG
jgi:hypothetical protein